MSIHNVLEQQKQPGWTPLHMAACNGHGAATRYLIQRRPADMKARTRPDGETPLHVAAHEGHGVVVQALVDHGADANARNKQGLTPLDVAVRRGHVEVVQLLMEERAKDANKELSPLQALRQEGDYFVEYLHWQWDSYMHEMLGDDKGTGKVPTQMKAEEVPLISSIGDNIHYMTMHNSE